MRIRCFDFDAECHSTSTVLPIRLFSQPPNSEWGAIGQMVSNRIRIEHLALPVQVQDFFRISLAVVAADHGVQRKTSQDGWTRQIELEVPVEEPERWNENNSALEKMLKFLTGDIWQLSYTRAQSHLVDTNQEPKYLKGNTVSLLSGGADSLVGALDLSIKDLPWTAISQTSSETQVQARFAEFAKATRHLPWTHGVHIPHEDEPSQRARSIGFFAFALVAAVSTEAYRDGEKAFLHASENGLISLNPALTPARIGSASTRTTHPCFVGQLQTLLDQLGINVMLKNDYQRMTKGEMFIACKEPTLLRSLLRQSMSCGKSGRINMHCGRCVPCVIRRAAFHRSEIEDQTEYQFGPGSDLDGFRRSDDVRCAYMGSSNYGDKKWVESSVLPSLFECPVENRQSLVDVAQRGLEEVHNYLVEALR